MKQNNMNWSIILILALPALVMGVLSLRGYTQGIEVYLWILLALFNILVVLKNQPAHPFMHLLLIGLFWGIINAITQSMNFDLYLANNLRAAASFSKLPPTINPRLIVLIIGPLSGLGAGIAMSAFAFILKKTLPFLPIFQALK